MNQKVLSYSDLKQAYLTITNLLLDASGERKITLKSRIQEDLGMYGDDNYCFILELQEKYNIDFSSFDYKKHFVDEGEVLSSPRLFIGILLLPINLLILIIAYLIKFIDKNFSIKIKNLLSYPNKLFKYRDTEDLTVGDIVASYIEGKFTLRSELKYCLKK